MSRNPLLIGALGSFLLPLCLVTAAFGSELAGLEACEMCWWQRWAHIYAMAPGCAAILFQTRLMRNHLPERADNAARTWLRVAALLILSSGLIGAYHAGVEYGWWEGHTACTSGGLAFNSLEDMAKRMAGETIVPCGIPQWTLFGISLAGYNAIISISGAVLVFLLSRRPSK